MDSRPFTGICGKGHAPRDHPGCFKAQRFLQLEAFSVRSADTGITGSELFFICGMLGSFVTER